MRCVAHSEYRYSSLLRARQSVQIYECRSASVAGRYDGGYQRPPERAFDRRAKGGQALRGSDLGGE